MARTRNKDNRKQEALMEDRLEALAEFEDYCDKVLPKIRRLLREGRKAEDIYKQFKDQLAARKLSIALDPNVDPGKALSAIMDIENRLDGKPVEKKEVAHKFDQLPDSQLDAMLLSQLESAASPGAPEDEMADELEEEARTATGRASKRPPPEDGSVN
jgi:hypothetical protein